MASTEVEIRDNRELRRVEAVDGDGEVAGFADYTIGVDGDTFDFTHTEVDDRFEGQGVGSRLAAGVLDFVRSEGATITPTCSFIRSYMKRHEDSHDLLAEGASLGGQDEDRKDEDSSQTGPADAKAAGAGGSAEDENRDENQDENQDENENEDEGQDERPEDREHEDAGS